MSDKEPMMFKLDKDKLTPIPANGEAVATPIDKAQAGYTGLKEATLLAFVPDEIRNDEDARMLYLKGAEFQITWLKVDPFAHLNQAEDTFIYELMRDSLSGWRQCLGIFVMVACKSPGKMAIKYRFEPTQYGAEVLAGMPSGEVET